MASNDNAGGPADESVEGSWSPRRSKGKAADGGAKGKGSAPDPEALAAEIERTREDLAETLDAIADKVSPKKVATRARKKVADAVKDGAHDAAEAVKGTADSAAEAVKGTVAAAKAKVGDEDAPRSPLSPPDIAVAQVPVEPAPTPGALADAAVAPVEPAGAEAPSYPATLPPAEPSKMPMLAGAAAALVVLLLLRRRRRR